MDNFELKELDAQRDDKDIYGVLYVPHEAKRDKLLPCIVFSHGMSSNHESGDGYAREFAKRGYVVCCFDFCGGAGSQSDGAPLEMTVFTERDDLTSVFDAVAALPYVDANNIFLMGASLGGAVTALAACERANRVKGLILLYPGFSLPDTIKQKCPDPTKLPESLQLNVEVGKDFVEELYGFDFYKVIGGYQGPVLIMHGTGDHTVPSGYSVKANACYRQSRLELIADAVHGFTGGYFKYAVRVIVDFLDEETDLADESGLNGDLNFGAPGLGGMGMGGMAR